MRVENTYLAALNSGSLSGRFGGSFVGMSFIGNLSASDGIPIALLERLYSDIKESYEYWRGAKEYDWGVSGEVQRSKHPEDVDLLRDKLKLLSDHLSEVRNDPSQLSPNSQEELPIFSGNTDTEDYHDNASWKKVEVNNDLYISIDTEYISDPLEKAVIDQFVNYRRKLKVEKVGEGTGRHVRWRATLDGETLTKDDGSEAIFKKLKEAKEFVFNDDASEQSPDALLGLLNDVVYKPTSVLPDPKYLIAYGGTEYIEATDIPATDEAVDEPATDADAFFDSKWSIARLEDEYDIAARPDPPQAYLDGARLLFRSGYEQGLLGDASWVRAEAKDNRITEALAIKSNLLSGILERGEINRDDLPDSVRGWAEHAFKEGYIRGRLQSDAAVPLSTWHAVADAVFNSNWSLERLADEYDITKKETTEMQGSVGVGHLSAQARLDNAREFFRNGYELGLEGDKISADDKPRPRAERDAFNEGYARGLEDRDVPPREAWMRAVNKGKGLQGNQDETLETSLGSYEPSPNSVYSTHLSGDDGGDHIQPLLSGANSTEERQAILAEWMERNPLAAGQLSSFMTKWARIMAYKPTYVTKKEDGTSVYTYHEDWEAMIAEEAERLRKENPNITDAEAYENAAKSLIGEDHRERMRYAALTNSIILGGFEETRMPSGYKEDEIPVLDTPDMYFGISSSMMAEYKEEAERLIREEFNLSPNASLTEYEEVIQMTQQQLAESFWADKLRQDPSSVMAEADAPQLVKAISSIIAIAESPGSHLYDRGLNTDISEDAYITTLKLADEAVPFTDFIDYLESAEMFGQSEATQEAINGILNYLGYDSIIDLRGVNPMEPTGTGRDTPATLTVFDSRKIKSGNPITFDNDGQIILPEDRIDLRDYDERRTQVAPFEPTTPPSIISGTHNGMEAIAANDSENTATDIKRRVNDSVGLALDVASSNGVEVTVVRSLDYAPGGSKASAPPMWARGKMVYVNPYGVARAISGLQDKDALHLSVTMVSEEMAHVASWNALSRADVQEVIDSIGDGDFTDIADEYYQDQSAKEAAFERLQSPDPVVSGKEKYRLIEEKMRMHAQRVVRGFTTEEDNRFFRSNPNLLQRAIRYMKGFLRRLLELRKVQRQNPHLARATDRIVTQLRAMRGNFKAPDIEPFDVNKPEAGMVALASQIDSTANLNDTSMLPVKYDEDNNIIQQPYDLLGSPLLTGKGFRNKGARDFTKPDYVELPYAVIKPDRAKVEAAIDSGAIDRAAALLAKQAEESLSDPELPEDIGQARFGVWGARSLRRLLYKAPVKASQSRWRIQPPAEEGISGGDLLAAELIFNRAAKQLDMKPEELHAVMQFAEKKIWAGNGWVDDAKQDVWSYPTDQEVSSAATAMNVSKLPKTFALLDKQGVKWESGSINADIGGGSFDNVTEALEKLGVVNYVYDPFNRTSEENREAVSAIRDGQADTATVNNVLNVIKEEEARELVIKQAANAIGRGGKAYFLIYEKDGDGVGKDTSRGWQNNRKAETYIPEIKKHFGEVTRKGTLITASPKTEDITLHTSISLRGVPDDAGEAIENIRSLGITTRANVLHGVDPVTAVRPSSLGFPKEWDVAYDNFKEVAEEGGIPNAYENIYFKVKPGVNYKNEVELSLLWVPHTMQRKGVAKALLKALFKKADKTGAMVSALAKAYTTDGPQGKELVSFYQRAGMTGVVSGESEAIVDPEGFIADTVEYWQELRDEGLESEQDWKKSDSLPLTSEEQRVLTTSHNFVEGEGEWLTFPLIDPVPSDAELEIAVRRKQKDEAAGYYVEEGLQIYRPSRGKKDAAPESLYPDLYTSIGVTPEQDARYLELAQNEEANMGELQQMVDERAKATGYRVGPVFHGSPAKFPKFRKRGVVVNFNNAVRNLGHFFGVSESYAKQYGENVTTAYLKGNFDESTLEVLDGLESSSDRNLRAWKKRRSDKGFTGVVFKDTRDGEYETLVVFNPNQIKSADPVTRDADGNVIPLSQRFDEDQESILYTSIGDTDLWDSQDSNAASFPDWNLDIGKLDEPRMRGITMAHRGVAEFTAPAGERLFIQRYPNYMTWEAITYTSGEVDQPKKSMWVSGGINADIGGGAAIDATNVLRELHGVTNVVYDPANRSAEHNEEAAKLIRGGQADTATVSSVLHSGVPTEVRAHAIELAADALKPDGTAYFLITQHGGDRYNESYNSFIKEIKQGFGEVSRDVGIAYRDGERVGSYGRLITARKPKKEIEGEEPIELASSIGSRPPTDEEILAATEFRHVLDLFDLPVLKAGGYKKPFKYKFMRWLAGSLDPRVRSLDDQRKFMMNQSLRTVTKFHDNLKAQAEAAYGSLGKAPVKVIAAAIGNTRGARPSSGDAKRIEDTLQAGIAKINASLKAEESVAKQGGITYKEIRASRKQAK